MDEQAEQNEPILKEVTSNENVSTISYAMFLDGYLPLPPFGNIFIDRMLLEPKVKMGLRFLKGPIIADTRVTVKATHPEVQAWMDAQIKRFMGRGMELALSKIERGFSANETVWEKNGKGIYNFKRLNHIDYRAVEPILKKGRVVGVQVKPDNLISNQDDKQNEEDQIERDRESIGEGRPLGGVKKLWTVHGRQFNSIYGRSQLLGSHIPYHELCSVGGIRDGINLWFRKNAFDGGILWVPDGNGKLDGILVENRTLGQAILNQKRSGGSIVMPSATDDKGNPLWRYEPPSSAEASATLLEWHDKLGHLIWEGMEVPPELSEGSEAGASNNKRVIQTAFYTLCTSIASNVIHDFNEQCLKPMCRMNFKALIGEENLDYEIEDITVISEMDYLNQQNQMGGMEDKKANNNPFSNGEIGPDVEEGNNQDRLQNPQQKSKKANAPSSASQRFAS